VKFIITEEALTLVTLPWFSSVNREREEVGRGEENMKYGIK